MKRFLHYFLIVVVILCLAGEIVAQKSQPGTPYSLSTKNQLNGRQSSQSFRSRKFDSKIRIDNKVEQERALQKKSSIGTEPYGVGISVSIDVKKDADLTKLEDGGNLWLMEIGSKDAFGLQLHFNKFKLPTGAKLYLYSKKDRSIKLGAYTKENNNPNNEFAIQIIKGDTLVLEYYEPPNPEFPGELKIHRIIHAFRSVFMTEDEEGGFGKSASCEVNVNCEPIYSEESKAVSRILLYDPATNLSTAATGAMINSVDHKPYLLTANHVYGSSAANQYFSTWIFYFNYEFPSCTSTSIEPDNTHTLQGAYVRSRGKLSDYMLLELADNPKSHYPVNYLGWDVTGFVPNSGVAFIHHPAFDVKKISLSYSDALQKVKIQDVNNQLVEVSGTPQAHYKFSWDEGTAEPGSSGGPLIDMITKRMVGTLTGGGSNCSQSGPIYFGILALSWENPDAGYTKLKDFLAGSGSSLSGINGDYNGDIGGQIPSGFVRINNISLTSDHWEDGPSLLPQVSNSQNSGTLSYSWSPAGDLFNPNEAVAILYFGGKRPSLPLTKTYTLTVTSSAGFSDSKSATVTVYDCENKSINVDVCSSKSTVIGYEPNTGESYSWSPAINLSSTNVSNPVFTPSASGTFVYTLTVTSPECTRQEVYTITSLNPPTPPAFVARKVADITLGGSSYDAAWDANLGLFNNKIMVTSSYSVHTNSRDHIGEVRHSTNSDEFNGFRLNTDLAKEYNFSTVALNSPSFDMHVASDGQLFIRDNLRLKKLDATGAELWRFSSPDLQSKLVNSHMTADGGVIIAYNIYNGGPHGVDFGQSALVKVDKNGAYVFRRYFKYPIMWFAMSQGNIGYLHVHDNKTSGTVSYFIHKINVTSGNFVEWSYEVPSMMWGGTVGKNLIATHDGGVLFAGVTMKDNLGSGFMLKLAKNGQKEWEKSFNKYDNMSSYRMQFGVVKQTSDLGYIVAYKTNLNAGLDKTENSRGNDDIWIAKFDAHGNKQGDKTIGGSESERPYDILQYDYKTYYIAGSSDSPISGEKSQASDYRGDLWVVKIVDDASLPPGNSAVTKICKVFNAEFNNTLDPFIDETIEVAGCTTSVVINSGAVVRARASQSIVIKPNTEIKAGADVRFQIGSLAVHPCNVDESGGRLSEEFSNTSTTRYLSEQIVNESLSSTRLRITPNPASDRCDVVFPEELDGRVRITVMNSLGQKVIEEEVDATHNFAYHFNLAYLHSGVITIKVENGDKVYWGRVVKK